MNALNASSRHNAPANVDRWVMRVAGLFILASLVLSQLHSVHWLWFTAFVGANLFQASITGFCPMAVILRRLGVQPGTAFPAPQDAR